MNFLAHAFLSGNNEKILVGNFIGDFVKGKNVHEQFDTEIALGISLHRHIDSYTDTHPVVRESKDKLRDKYRHYAAVIVDIFYDHFLAKNWPQFHDQPLATFARYVYQTMDAYRDVVPEEVNYFLPYMVRDNWLVNYASTEGIHRSLAGMSRRTKFNSRMEEAVIDLKRHYDSFEKEFLLFFPQLQQDVAAFMKT